MQTENTKNMRTVAGALLLLSAAALVFGRHSESQIPFDSAIWKHQVNSSERLRMVGDLKTKLISSGREEIEQILGEPRRGFDSLHPNDYYYLLGTQERLLDTDGIWLRITFQNDRVCDMQVIHD